MQALQNTDRAATLRRTRLLDSPPEESFDRLTRLGSKVLHVPVALVSLVEEDRQFFKSQVGLADPIASRRETPLSHSFCKHVVASREPLVIEDAREDPLVRENLAVRDLGVIAYAGIPLITSEGHALGSFCVIDHQPRRWSKEDLDILTDVTASVITEIEYRLKAREVDRLLRAARKLHQPTNELREHLETLTRLLQPHDDERIQHFVMLAADRVRRLKKIEGELENVHRTATERPDIGFLAVDLTRRVSRAVQTARTLTTTHTIHLEADGQPLRINCDSLGIETAVVSLLTTAINYSPGTARIDVRLRRVDGEALLEVQDYGRGMPAADMTRILSRFRQITCADLTEQQKKNSGTGLRIAGNAVIATGEGIEIVSVQGKGTTFRLRVPIVRSTPEEDAPRERRQLPQAPEPRRAETAPYVDPLPV